MKNKFFIIFIISIILCNFSYADQFTFETKEIEIKDNTNVVYAKNGKAFSKDKKLEIEAENFEYFKKLKQLKAFNGEATLNLEKLKIKFDKLELDQKNSIIQAYDNIKIIDLEKKLTIVSNLIIYNQKKNILTSNEKSILKDKYGNEFITQSFEYDLKKMWLK